MTSKLHLPNDHRFQHTNKYRGDNTPLCNLCFQPKSSHKFGQTTKLASSESPSTDGMEWLDEILKVASWQYSHDLNGRIDDRGLERFNQAKAAIATKMQEREQAIWQRVAAAIPSEWHVSSPFVGSRVAGYNDVIREINLALPELANVRKEQK